MTAPHASPRLAPVPNPRLRSRAEAAALLEERYRALRALVEAEGLGTEQLTFEGDAA